MLGIGSLCSSTVAILLGMISSCIPIFIKTKKIYNYGIFSVTFGTVFLFIIFVSELPRIWDVQPITDEEKLEMKYVEDVNLKLEKIGTALYDYARVYGVLPESNEWRKIIIDHSNILTKVDFEIKHNNQVEYIIFNNNLENLKLDELKDDVIVLFLSDVNTENIDPEILYQQYQQRFPMISVISNKDMQPILGHYNFSTGTMFYWDDRYGRTKNIKFK